MTDAPGRIYRYRCRVCGFEWETTPLDSNEQGMFREMYGSDDFDTLTVPVTCTPCFVRQCEDRLNALKEKFGWN